MNNLSGKLILKQKNVSTIQRVSIQESVLRGTLIPSPSLAIKDCVSFHLKENREYLLSLSERNLYWKTSPEGDYVWALQENKGIVESDLIIDNEHCFFWGEIELIEPVSLEKTITERISFLLIIELNESSDFLKRIKMK